MKKQSDWQDIKINKRSTDKVYFESPILQSISDKIDFLREESKEILKELDSTEFKQQIDEWDLEDLGVEALNQISGIVDEIVQFKDEIIDSDEIPEEVKEYSKDFKVALNRDADYVRKAKRRLARDDYDNNERIVQLCDKAIEVNDSNWEAYHIKGIALINLDKYGEACEELTKSLELNEDNDNARLYLANAYRLNREFEKAIEAYDSVLENDEKSFDAYKGKAFTYYNWKKYDKADECFKKANSITFLDEKSKEVWKACSD